MPVIPTISKDHSAFMFRLKLSKNGQPDFENSVTTMFQNGSYSLASIQEGPGWILGQSLHRVAVVEVKLQVLQSLPVSFIPPSLFTHVSFTNLRCYTILASECVVN
jgi:hypothetical protein